MSVYRSIISKLLLTRLVYLFEQRRTYVIRSKVFSFPPLHIRGDTDAGTLVIVSAPRYIVESCWAAYSILSRVPIGTRLKVLSHGELSENVRAAVAALFPGLDLLTTDHCLARISTGYPHLLRFAETHPLGAKLASILVLQLDECILYSDSDVLSFRGMPEIEEAISQSKSNYHLVDANNGLTNSTVQSFAAAKGLVALPCLNSGFMFIRKRSLSLDLAEELLAACASCPDFDNASWFIEQTIFAILMSEAQSLPLSPKKYVVSMARQFYWQGDIDYNDIAIRHFVGPVRHRMYSVGMPIVERDFMSPQR